MSSLQRGSAQFPLVILSVDPGQSTGLAWVKLSWPNPPEVLRTRTESYSDTIDTLLSLKWVADKCPDVIVCEQYSIRPTTRWDAGYGARICGAVDCAYRLTCSGDGVVYQQPSDIKTMVSTKLIQRLGWPYESLHELDALRHAYLYIVKQYPAESIRAGLDKPCLRRV